MDKVTLDIIWGKLQATSDEMGVILAKASMSPVIYEVLDFACGLCDNKGECISIQNGITIFTGTFTSDVQIILKKFDKDINNGDIFLLNDPHYSGTHLNDVSVIKPIFVDDKLIAFAIADAHWADIGGSAPGSISPQASEIYQEGVQLPGVRLYKKGDIQKDIIDIISSNVRYPTLAIGDLNAEVAAVNIAEKRLNEIVKKYGADKVFTTFEYLKDTSEKISIKAIQSMPNGIYEVEDIIDGDSFKEDPIPIKLKLTIKDEEIEFDFEGTSDFSESPLKCGKGALFSQIKTVFKSVVDPHGFSNEGWFRPLKLKIPDGTVFSATYPESTGWYFETSSYAADLVWKAFASIIKNKTSAGHYLALSPSFLYGTDHRNNEPFFALEPHCGGWGASNDSDGTSGLIGILDGDTYNYSIELFENKFPMRCNQFKFNTEDGVGHGEFRGGFGLIREYELLCDDVSFYCADGRTKTKPWGIYGGTEGSNNYKIIRSNGKERKITITPPIKLNKGDTLKIVTASGGGYGKPENRERKRVLDDLENEFITPEIAQSVYKLKDVK